MAFDTLPPDPYTLLGVSKDAQLPEIRSAHRKLVLKCHPDKVQDAALKAIKQDEFQKVQQAYELLSDDSRRTQYDEQVKLMELRKEMAAMGRGVPSARSNPFEYEVKTAEPRTTTYTYSRSKPAPRETTKVYPQQQQPRSFEEFTREEPIRHPKKSASYESADRDRKTRSSTREEERARDTRRHDDEERARQKWEKESKRAAHGEKKKSREKEKKRSSEEKYSSRNPYVEEESSDDHRAARSEKKARQRIEEEIRLRNEEAAAARAAAERSSARQAPLQQKWDDHKEYAAQYMQAARRKAAPAAAEEEFRPRPMQRAETFAAIPTKYDIRYAAPQPSSPFIPSDDDSPRRSSARTRRTSETPATRSKDFPKFSSKEKERDKERRKSPRSRSREANAYIVEPPSPPPMPKSAKIPSLQTHSSAPPIIPGFVPRKEPNRARTQEYPRKEQVVPPLPRAATFQSGDRADPRDPRGRGGSRLKNNVDYTSESDSDSPPYPAKRHSHSPPRRQPEPTRYIIDNGRSVPITSRGAHRDHMRNVDTDVPYPRDRSESPGGGRHPQASERPPLARNPGSGAPSRQPSQRTHSQAYYPPEAPEPFVLTARPKMPSRESLHVHGRSSSGRGSGGVASSPYFPEEIKYATAYRPEDVVYNDAYRRGSDPSHSHGHAREYYPAPPQRGERVYGAA